jgi:hypothetical protein|tara:strand:- start:4621 stop:4809 length:189 start_codon:yes stop_codon:yes gene_type:complete
MRSVQKVECEDNCLFYCVYSHSKYSPASGKNVLYRWKKLHEQKIQGKVLGEDEREELKRLRK